MTCCTLLVAATLAMGYGDIAEPAHGGFGTPMFLRGQPVWVTPISRRQLRRDVAEREKQHAPMPESDIALRLA